MPANFESYLGRQARQLNELWHPCMMPGIIYTQKTLAAAVIVMSRHFLSTQMDVGPGCLVKGDMVLKYCCMSRQLATGGGPC